ncbi:SHOCT domain-containing protein [Lysobacter korlensis]|uniref:SHOCT domain-containing protein n=1 Tax=Lysobacter korlensis TaxID=553636 RepID=A0ABV6RYZ0_9GAMM
MPENPPDTSGFDLMFGIVLAVVIAGFAVTVALLAVNARRVRRAGHNPVTLNADLAVRVLESDLLAPGRSKEHRLRELDDLHARGVITAEEHRTARAEVLSAP